jgi:hypothetical protein
MQTPSNFGKCLLFEYLFISDRMPSGSPKGSPNASPKSSPNLIMEEMDVSMAAWLANSYQVLQMPGTILSVAGLLVAGAFAEIAPRKSLEFLDNIFGSFLFFVLPLLFAIFLDWPTGLLAAVVSLILFARLQKQDSSEGFSDSLDDANDKNTKIISNTHRWFIERMLGERPVAISSDRIITSAVQDSNVTKGIEPSMPTYSSPQISSLSVESSSSSHK